MSSVDCTQEGRPQPVEAQLAHLAGQIRGLQEQLDELIARRNAGVAARASQHVASIVAAAQQSAAEIRARAENDAAILREQLLAEVQVEAEQIRSKAHADAARIRSEARARVAHAGERAITAAAAPAEAPKPGLGAQITAEVRSAVQELHGATAVLEQSLRNIRASDQEVRQR